MWLGEARYNMWLGERVFYVARREGILCGQER